MKKSNLLILIVLIVLLGWNYFRKPAAGHYSSPPTVNVGMTADQAYAAIPHRRTLWEESTTTVPAEERIYLRDMFQAIDEATAVRVAGLQDYGLGRFQSDNIDGQYDKLIDYVRGMPAPSKLEDFHSNVLREFSDQRKFFADWKTQRKDFQFAHKIENSPDVQDGAGAGHNAYDQLMSNYPNETAKNKDAFYDYLCALDFL